VGSVGSWRNWETEIIKAIPAQEMRQHRGIPVSYQCENNMTRSALAWIVRGSESSADGWPLDQREEGAELFVYRGELLAKLPYSLTYTHTPISTALSGSTSIWCRGSSSRDSNLFSPFHPQFLLFVPTRIWARNAPFLQGFSQALS
jgi:hypothetical protein